MLHPCVSYTDTTLNNGMKITMFFELPYYFNNMAIQILFQGDITDLLTAIQISENKVQIMKIFLKTANPT